MIRAPTALDAAVGQGCRADQDGHADEADRPRPGSAAAISRSSANRRCDSTATISGEEAWIIAGRSGGKPRQGIGQEHVRQPAVEGAEGGPDPPFMPLSAGCSCPGRRTIRQGSCRRSARAWPQGRRGLWLPLSLISRSELPHSIEQTSRFEATKAGRGNGRDWRPLPLLAGTTWEFFRARGDRRGRGSAARRPAAWDSCAAPAA